MQLHQRQTQLEDLPACADLLREGFLGTDRALVPELLEMWEALIETSSANSALIEDRSTQPYRTMGFGLSIYVTDQFVAEAKTNAQPYITHLLLQCWRENRFPGLGLADIRQHNKQDGVNVLAMYALRESPDLKEADRVEMREKMRDTLFATHRGYNIKSFMKEIYGEEDKDRHNLYGFMVLNDYAASMPALGTSYSNRNQRPYLVGLSRETALSPEREGMFIRELFRSNQPVCSFTPADQEVLQLAMTGLSEGEIAGVLGITKGSVKSRWDSIYSHLPTALEHSLFTSQEGQLKSRSLLNWLRKHPEEIRPTLFFKGIDLIGDYSRVTQDVSYTHSNLMAA